MINFYHPWNYRKFGKFFTRVEDHYGGNPLSWHSYLQAAADASILAGHRRVKIANSITLESSWGISGSSNNDLDGVHYYGGGTIVRGDNVSAGGKRRAISFDYHCSNVRISNLTFDFMGVAEYGAMFWFSPLQTANFSNITFEKLTFVNNRLDIHSGGGDDWGINCSCAGTTTNLCVMECVHNTPRHQFLAGGYRSGSVTNGVYFLNNTCNGARSVTLDVLRHNSDEGVATLSNIFIIGNTIINPWRWAIAAGIDGTGTSREVRVSGLEIAYNTITWNSEGDTYSSTQRAQGILITTGDEAGSVCQGTIHHNTVTSTGHTAKEITGCAVAGGTYAGPSPNLVIRDNNWETVGFSGVNRSSLVFNKDPYGVQMFPDLTTPHLLFDQTTPVRIDTNINNDLDITGDLTISFWFLLWSLEDVDDTFLICSNSDDTNSCFEISLRSENGSEGCVRYYSRATATTNRQTTEAIPIKEWSHVAVTRSIASNFLRIYINNVLATGYTATPGAANTRAASTVTTKVGCNGLATSNYITGGGLRDFRIYNVSMDTTAIGQLYADTYTANAPLLRYKLDAAGNPTTVVPMAADATLTTTGTLSVGDAGHAWVSAATFA